MSNDYVQINYDRVLADGLPGSFADNNPRITRSFIAEQDVPFGVVISQGSLTGIPTGAVLGGGTIAATAGYLQGTAASTGISTIEAIIDGAIKVTIDGTVRTLTALDFTGVNTYADVAGVINTAVATWGTCTYSPVTGCFRFTSGTTGASSAVSAVADNTTGTSLLAILGMSGTNVIVAGTASHTAVVLGVTVLHSVVESGYRTNSNLPLIRANDVGAYLEDGAIKVMAKADVVKGGDVYFDNTTGEFYAASGSGKTKLGSAKYKTTASSGSVVIVDVTGLR